jgi:hypothetical protein
VPTDDLIIALPPTIDPKRVECAFVPLGRALRRATQTLPFVIAASSADGEPRYHVTAVRRMNLHNITSGGYLLRSDIAECGCPEELTGGFGQAEEKWFMDWWAATYPDPQFAWHRNPKVLRLTLNYCWEGLS